MRPATRYLSLSMYDCYLKRSVATTDRRVCWARPGPRWTRTVTRCTATLLLICATGACRAEKPSSSPASAPAAAATGWRADDEQYRRDLEKKLTSETGWLTIAGLAFLTEHETTFGSDPSNDVVLPGTAPAHVGTFVMSDDRRVSVRLEPGVKVALLDGRPFSGGPIKSDGEGAPDRLVLGDVQVWVHQSGDRPAIRIRDKNAPLRKAFTGMKWFPLDPDYRVEATFVPYSSPKTFQIPNLLGDIDRMTAPGQVTFTLQGREHRMTAFEDGQDLWFVFRDLTSGETTYPAARFLYTPLPKDGKVVLDFNRAENPPCAFNPYATCPLPPPENRMTVRVEAGEQYQRH
jgi:uncharacterized protein (DUF1684 family)